MMALLAHGGMIESMPELDMVCLECGWYGMLGFLGTPVDEVCRCPKCGEPVLQKNSIVDEPIVIEQGD